MFVFSSRSFAKLSGCVLLITLLSVLSVSAGEWIEYRDCRLGGEKYFDGDSFSRVEGRRVGASRNSKMNWRLYGVDCPETDRRYPERIVEQARAFRIPEDDVIRWGEKAKAFSADFLSRPFTVFTLREKAGGTSDKNRYYAIIQGADGRFLHEALLEAGLARAYGMPTPWPERTRPDRFMSRLEILERSARSAQVGIWSR